MEVAYLLTAEIPSEFHCAQITTFHIQQRYKQVEKSTTINIYSHWINILQSSRG